MSSQPAATFPSLQMEGVSVVDVPVDVDAAASRLSRAIQFRTQSNQDRDDFDTMAFEDFHAFLRESFPAVHANLTLELLGDPGPTACCSLGKARIHPFRRRS